MGGMTHRGTGQVRGQGRHTGRGPLAQTWSSTPPPCQTSVCSTGPHLGEGTGRSLLLSIQICSIRSPLHTHSAKRRHANVCPPPRLSPRALPARVPLEDATPPIRSLPPALEKTLAPDGGSKRLNGDTKAPLGHLDHPAACRQAQTKERGANLGRQTRRQTSKQAHQPPGPQGHRTSGHGKAGRGVT